MKKLLAVLLTLAMLLSAAALAETEPEPQTQAQTEPDGVTGVWYMREMISGDGETLRPEAMGMVFTVELIDDGSAIVSDVRGAYQQVDKGVWRQEGDMLSVVIDDDFSILMRMEGDALTAERPETKSKWVFSREAPGEAYQPAEPAEAEPEAFAGTWTVEKVQIAGLYYGADTLGGNPGVEIVDDTLTPLGGIPCGTTPVTVVYADGRLQHEGLEEEPRPVVTLPPPPSPTPVATPTPEATATPEPAPVEVDGRIFIPTPTPVATATPVATPTPEPTPTPTPDPTMEPRLRTSRYDLLGQMLEDGTMSLTVGLDRETLYVFIMRRV